MRIDIHPIRDDQDHARALAQIERLWSAELGSRAGDLLEVLSTLVEAYEREHHAIDPPDPIEAIKFRVEQAGLDRAALAEILGSKARVSEILNRKRRLTLPMIRALNAKLGIPAEVLIRESTMKKPKRTGGRPKAVSRRTGVKRAARGSKAR
jgi:HTH-type transcriptional regulator/antitoxin HigA